MSEILEQLRNLPQSQKNVILQKLSKAKNDPVFFLKKFAIIRHPQKGKIPFALYKFQQQVVVRLNTKRFVSIGKSRQLGISTVVAGYVAWLMLFYKDKQISIICTKQKTAKNLLRKVKLIFQMLPKWLRPLIVQDNKKSISLSNGSMCYAQGTTQNAGRSQSLSLLILDQVRFIDGVQQIWKAAYPTLSTGGSCVLLSTPNGVNWFHKMHSRRRREQNQFYALDLPWWLHPQRDQKWKQKQVKNLGGIKHFRQQHQIDFQSSGKSIVDLDVIRQLQASIKKNFSKLTKNHWVDDLYTKILDFVAQDGLSLSRQMIQKLWIFDIPQPDIAYTLSCDVGNGVGQDSSTIIVWDTMKYQQVRQFKGIVKPSVFSDIIYIIRKRYGDAYVVVQSNKDGSAVNSKLQQQLKYRKLHYLTKTHKDQFGLKVQVPGFQTTGKTRPVMVSKMQADITKKDAIIKSIRLTQQLKTFVDNNGKPQHLPGYNDDLVIRMRIFSYLRGFILMRNTDWRLVNRFSSSSNNSRYRNIMNSQSQQINGWVI